MTRELLSEGAVLRCLPSCGLVIGAYRPYKCCAQNTVEWSAHMRGDPEQPALAVSGTISLKPEVPANLSSASKPPFRLAVPVHRLLDGPGSGTYPLRSEQRELLRHLFSPAPAP